MTWFFRTLWACASNPHSYPPLALAAWRAVRNYLLLLIALTSLLLSLAMGRLLQRHMDELLIWAQQLPTIVIEHGVARFPDEAPWRMERIDVAGLGDVVIGFDPTDATDPFDGPVDVGVMVRPREVVVAQRGTLRHYPLEGIARLTIDEAFLAQWARRLTWWLRATLPCVLFVYGVIAKLLQAGCWSGVIYLVLGSRLHLSFGALFRLAIFALGPPTVFAAVVEFLYLERAQPLLWCIYLGIYGVLYSRAIQATMASHGEPTGSGH